MLSDSEWIEIYRYLLQKLRDVADNSLLLDVERAASARIEDDVNEDSELVRQFSREYREDLAPVRLRAPSPREAFTAVIGVLIARLHEVPVLADRLADKFGCDVSDIQWYFDVSERDQVSERVSFSAYELKLREGEYGQVEAALKRLENLLKERQ